MLTITAKHTKLCDSSWGPVMWSEFVAYVPTPLEDMTNMASWQGYSTSSTYCTVAHKKDYWGWEMGERPVGGGLMMTDDGKENADC